MVFCILDSDVKFFGCVLNVWFVWIVEGDVEGFFFLCLFLVIDVYLIENLLFVGVMLDGKCCCVDLVVYRVFVEDLW